MHAISDHEHAPTWTVSFNVFVEKLPRYERSRLSPRVRLVKRIAGHYVAWTEGEAIDAARRAGTLPESAHDARAARHEDAESPLFF